jgi:outer membrane beta-barrel protein
LGFARLFYHLGIALISVFFVASIEARAQGLPGSDIPQTTSTPPAANAGASAGAGSSDSDVEALYDKDDSKTSKAVEKKPEAAAAAKKAAAEVQNLSDLAKLAPFSDVAVIERRFLPKTQRFEVSADIFTNLNNPFYTAYGGEGKLAYYFTERWALEGIGQFATTSSREATDDLVKNRNITTTNDVTARSFFGGAVKWNPIYGKITLLNKSIIPFDLNFDVGGGMTNTTDNQTVPTFHFSTAQVFAWTKATAFRWDFSMNYYTANTGASGGPTKISQFDLYLGVGMSFYFPEASYR